ncbi:MAG: hypothetical protein QY326_00680 [Bdellovibrionota bacterium]|nr:MAG: hypothetical protein QY326_00680 [Bdellovibrionota bacterium]
MTNGYDFAERDTDCDMNDMPGGPRGTGSGKIGDQHAPLLIQIPMKLGTVVLLFISLMTALHLVGKGDIIRVMLLGMFGIWALVYQFTPEWGLPRTKYRFYIPCVGLFAVFISRSNPVNGILFFVITVSIVTLILMFGSAALRWRIRRLLSRKTPPATGGSSDRMRPIAGRARP